MKTSIRIVLMLLALVGVSISAQAVVVLQPLSTFGTHGDGSVRVGDVPGLTADGQLQRGLAYNPVTGHLLYVDRSTNGSSINYVVYILDGNTGAQLGTLANISPLGGGNAAFVLNLLGVADDGAIYAANLSNATTPGNPQVRLYRWADENDPAPTFVSPTGAFPADDPSNGAVDNSQKRWGDTLAVRGAGLNTQIIMANRGTLTAIYTPDDISYSHFTPKTLTSDVTNSGAFGTGLSFGAGNTFWATSGANGNGPLYHMSFNLGAGTATTITNIPSPRFPGRISPLLVMPSSNLLAGITMVGGADVVRLYDITDANNPALLDRKSFVTNRDNATFSGSLALGTNGVLYALDSDNGIQAFTITDVSTNPLAPAFFANPAGDTIVVGATATLSAAADGTAPLSYQWLFNGTNLVAGATSASLTITNAQTTNAGNYSLVATNFSGGATSSVANLIVLAAPPNTLLAYEPFDYAASQLLTAANPTWTLNGSGNDSSVAAGSLTIPGLAAPIGNSVTNGGSGAGLRYPLSSTIVDGSLYYSFAFRMDSVGTAFNAVNSFIAAFVDPAGSSTYQARLMPRTNTIPGQYNLGITKITASGTGPVWATNNFVEGEVVFLVVRYTFNNTSTTDDQVDMWVNPDSSTFGAAAAPTPTLSAAQTGTDQNLISQFTFRQNTAGNTPAAMAYDELRIGLKWADVTPSSSAPAPKPSLKIVDNANGTVTMSWPTNSTGYSLVGSTSVTASLSTWAAVPESIVVVGTNNTVTVSGSTGLKFFSLKK